MDVEVHRASARVLARRVQAREVSALEVAQAMCERIARIEPQINAFADFDPQVPLAAARLVDERLARGEALPLAGVPFTVKDNLWLGGRPATFGSHLFVDFVAPRDSWCVARLRELGAVPLGVTNCSEFACKGVTSTPLHGHTRNPWDLQRTPGGSSGGAVAAVAAGIGPLALGTDAGGSTRRPAAHTGLVGMKPTLGRVPNPWGFDDPNHLVSVIGQIGRDVEDVAWMLDLLTAWEPADPLSCPAFATPDAMAALRQPLPRLRLAYSPQLGIGIPIDADVRAAVDAAVARLRASGWAIEEADPELAGTATRVPADRTAAGHAGATVRQRVAARAGSLRSGHRRADRARLLCHRCARRRVAAAARAPACEPDRILRAARCAAVPGVAGGGVADRTFRSA